VKEIAKLVKIITYYYAPNLSFKGLSFKEHLADFRFNLIERS